jgi:hypothetical protein
MCGDVRETGRGIHGAGALAWDAISFTEHMVEAAAVVAECQVAFDFEGHEQVCYEVKVFRVLKGAATQPFFAVASDRGGTGTFRPFGEGATAEEALEACLASAGIHHRRRVKQSEG